MFCHNCGRRNPVGVNFCSSCGAALVPSASDTTVSVQPVEGVGDGYEEDTALAIGELPRGVAMLVVKRGPNSGVRFVLDEPVVRAGRHPESDIFLDDITVSRRHAEFTTDDGVTTVRDVGSLNGTYVNRERIEEARLASGDEVQIGKFKLVFLVATGE
ncbi:MAG: FHA domain-containing protein [Actinomycetota bacterium]|nr:FHA domain-containing protein [Actinomycetota bacterium]